jgi:hypothetical protein
VELRRRCLEHADDLIAGAERVLSLASFITKDDVRCLKGNYNTRIDANLEFLAPYLPAPPAPADLGTDLGVPMDASGADG